MVYRQHNPEVKCNSCGVKPKLGTVFNRNSPNASLVSEHLGKVFGDESCNILSSDVIYYNCYKHHLQMLKSLECNSIGSNKKLEEDIVSGQQSMKITAKP